MNNYSISKRSIYPSLTEDLTYDHLDWSQLNSSRTENMQELSKTKKAV